MDKSLKKSAKCDDRTGKAKTGKDGMHEMDNPTNPRARIPRALRLIRARLRDPDLSPSLIAGQVDLDLPVFCRAFKQVTGITCTDYIAIERIRLAKRLLTKHDLLIKEIAYEVGFENANYFSRRFREMEGRTPSSYRRLNHTGAG